MSNSLVLLVMVLYFHLVSSFNRHQFLKIGNSVVSRNKYVIRTNQYHRLTRLYCTKFDIETLRGFKISDYWIDHLRNLERPAAYELIHQLKPNANELGYESNKAVKTPQKPSGFFHDTVQNKIKYDDKVILVRNGEFYETYGVDALMLINYCGLNPMAGTCRAGCPVKNIQDTLDGLTNAGLSVAVFEEVVETNTNKGPTRKSGGKERFLSQIVSPAYRTYAFNLNLRQGNIEYRDPVPLWGVMKTVGGYLACQVWLDEQKVLVSERLTAEAVRILMAESSYIEPIFVNPEAAQDTALEPLPQISIISGYFEKEFTSQVLQRIQSIYQIDIKDFKQLPMITKNRPRMLYTSTALQIGLLPNTNVPSLTPFLLPRLVSAHSSRFLNKWVLHPPPAELADHMQSLCRHLSQLSVGLPTCNPIPLGKVISLLKAKQSNVVLFKDIRTNVNAVLYMLDTVQSDPTHPFRQVIDSIMPIVTFETGISIAEDILLSKCQFVTDTINAFIDASADSDMVTVDLKGRIPDNFFIQNEDTFRGQISILQPNIAALYNQLKIATQNLLDVVNKDFPSGYEVVFDFHENALFAKPGKEKSPSTRSRSKKLTNSNLDSATAPPDDTLVSEVPSVVVESVKLIPAKDRYGKPLPGKFTTDAVSRALAEYVEMAESAPDIVVQELQELSGKLLEELAVVQQCAHWAVVQSAIVGHVTAAKQNGWTLPKLQPLPEEQEASPESISATPSKLMTMKIKGMTPYWIDRARAIDNDLDLTGTFLLTAPNMSGKSTIMRASLVVALLANCGLFVPAQYASIPRYDSFFLRTASYDVPSESKSAFGLECDDVKVLTRDYTSRSLIMIDELGKGTSARDGAALAGALLEALDDCGCSGIFATHLHEVFQLPLVLNRVTYKRMGIEQVDESRESDDKRWTYKLEDGKCIDSLALQTARQYNIPLSIIKRAEQLAAIFDDTCRGGKPILSSSTGTLSSSSTITTISAYETKRLSTPSVTLSEEQDQVYVSTEKELEMTTTDVTAASMSTVIVDTPRKVWTSSRVIFGPKTSNLTLPISPSISSTLPSTPSSTTPVASVFSPRPKPAAISPATTDDPLYSAKREIVLDTLITLFKRLSGLKQIPIIESDMIPPPSLEGQAAVYVLHIQSKPLYVGETESIGQRLKQHRRDNKGLPIRAAVMVQPNKSAARQSESRTIKALKEKGYAVVRDSDESHNIFSQP